MFQALQSLGPNICLRQLFTQAVGNLIIQVYIYFASFLFDFFLIFHCFSKQRSRFCGRHNVHQTHDHFFDCCFRFDFQHTAFSSVLQVCDTGRRLLPTKLPRLKEVILVLCVVGITRVLDRWQRNI